MRPTMRVVVALAVLAAAAGCGSSTEDDYANPSLPKSPSVSPSPTSTLTPAQQEVIDRYLLYVKTLEKLYETTDPTHVHMTDVAMGAQFRHAVESAIQMKSRKEYAKGHFENRVTFKSLNDRKSVATLVVCGDSNNFRTYDRSTNKEKYPDVEYPIHRLNVELQKADGVWKVSRVERVGQC